jgi:hypothetical protein
MLAPQSQEQKMVQTVKKIDSYPIFQNNVHCVFFFPTVRFNLCDIN